MKPRTARIVAEGLVAGGVGTLGIGVVVAVADVTAGRSPFFTPSLLGTALFANAGGACLAAVGPMPVLSYLSIHLTTLTALGVLASWLVHESERHPMLWYFTLMTFLVAVWHLAAAVVGVLGAAQGCVSLGWILGASAAGAAAMATYLVRAHRVLRRELAGNRYA